MTILKRYLIYITRLKVVWFLVDTDKRNRMETIVLFKLGSIDCAIQLERIAT